MIFITDACFFLFVFSFSVCCVQLTFMHSCMCMCEILCTDLPKIKTMADHSYSLRLIKYYFTQLLFISALHYTCHVQHMHVVFMCQMTYRTRNM